MFEVIFYKYGLLFVCCVGSVDDVVGEFEIYGSFVEMVVGDDFVFVC